jgi:single-strand DNA-binding protein
VNTKNVVFLVGRLAADPELRYTPNGTAVATFAVAVNRSVRKPDGTFEDALDGFFDCEIFGPQAEALAESTRKGHEVQLSGSLLQKKFKTNGEQSRTVSKVEIRVATIARVMSAPRTVDSVTPAQVASVPQPA